MNTGRQSVSSCQNAKTTTSVLLLIGFLDGPSLIQPVFISFEGMIRIQEINVLGRTYCSQVTVQTV